MFKLIKSGKIHKYEDKLSVLDSGHTSRTECSYILSKFLFQSLISVVWPLSNLQKHFLNSEAAIRGVLRKRCSWKFRKIYRKIRMHRSHLFNKIAGLGQPVKKRDYNTGVLLWNLRNFKNTFIEHLHRLLLPFQGGTMHEHRAQIKLQLRFCVLIKKNVLCHYKPTHFYFPSLK